MGRSSVRRGQDPYRRRGHRRACRIVSLALLLSAPSAAPASASTVPVTAMSTVNWSGYALAGNDFTGVTGTFNVPAPPKSAACLQQTGVWVGVDGLDDHDLLQAGIAETGLTQAAPTDWPSPGFPGVVCSGRVQVYAWWEDLPSQSVRLGIPVNVGDKVSVSIFEMSPGWWAMTVHDLTSGLAYFRSQPYAGPQSSVEWVVEAPAVLGLVTDPVPFSAVTFAHVGAQGQASDLVRLRSGSKGKFSSDPRAVVSTADLMRHGFTVRYAA
jgi:Peptidase A4 family